MPSPREGLILAQPRRHIPIGGLYGAIIRRYQVKMARLSSDAAQGGTAVPPEFFTVLRKWSIAGGLATILPLLALYFMVAKPL